VLRQLLATARRSVSELLQFKNRCFCFWKHADQRCTSVAYLADHPATNKLSTSAVHTNASTPSFLTSHLTVSAQTPATSLSHPATLFPPHTPTEG
jgi:hypothetical protein